MPKAQILKNGEMIMRNILFVASECYPFIKTGGLADVVGALPKMLDEKEFDVRVVIPKYMCIPWEYRQHFNYVTSFYMDLGHFPDHKYVGIMEYIHDGIHYYFIDNEGYFGGDTPYTNNLKWDIERFTFFSKAALAILPAIGFKPDLIHCHDWQAALTPVFLRTLFRDNSFFWGIKSMLTIHNLKFQGIWDIETMRRFTGFPEYVFTSENMEYKKDANMLKGGIVFSDYVTTVSDTYAQEIQQPYYGEGLDGLMRHKSQNLCGIVNGIDYDVWAPGMDIQIYHNYASKTFYQKVYNKRGMQHELGLPEDDNKFMIGIISRLTDQKGLDLVNEVIENITDENTQFVVLGTGDPKYEDLFRHYQWKYPERVSANIYYSDNRAHKLYAAADAMLMPSRFEPCGLTQLISLRYGTVPIVRETGGLKDTVQPYNWYDNSGTGFTFSNYDAGEMLNAINYAKTVFFTQRDRWNEIAVRGMRMDYSWANSAKRYEDLYRWIMSWW